MLAALLKESVRYIPLPNISPTADSIEGILRPSLIVAKTELGLTPDQSKNLLCNFF
jgi:hypothetical protein